MSSAAELDVSNSVEARKLAPAAGDLETWAAGPIWGIHILYIFTHFMHTLLFSHFKKFLRWGPLLL